jgi:hypothetical protein
MTSTQQRLPQVGTPLRLLKQPGAEDRLAKDLLAKDLLAKDLLESAWQDCEHYESTLPHLLICTDLGSGERSYSGPFPSLAQAESVRDHELRGLGNEADLEFSTAALYPALELRA